MFDYTELIQDSHGASRGRAFERLLYAGPDTGDQRSMPTNGARARFAAEVGLINKNGLV